MAFPRILLIENHVPLAELVVDILQRVGGLEVAGVARDLASATRLMNSPIDLVIQDLDLPDATGMAAIRLTLEKLPSANVIVLADQDGHHYQEAARRQGARRCIRKDLIATDLVPIVREIAGDYSSVR